MRVLLHIGMPKAGSTALQGAFAAARSQLRKKGILYPKVAFNHNFLIAGLAPPDRIGRVFAQQYAGNTEAVAADFADFWSRIIESVQRRKPSVVILSAESVYNPVGEAGPERLRALLAPLAARTEVICYVRRPSDYYRSMAQQQLRASSVIRPVGAVKYRATLEAALAATDAVHVVPYERSQFPGGDIVADFAARFIPDAAVDLAAVNDRKVNPSMSAEAMDIVQAYRRERHPGENDRFTQDTRLLVRRLAQREAELGGQRRPELVPRVRDHVDHSSVDLIWLRDTFGVVFDGIDYQAIAARDGFRPEAVTDICIVDPVRRAALAETASTSPTEPAEDRPTKAFRSAYVRRPRG